MNYPNGQMIRTQTRAQQVVKAAEIHRRVATVKFQS